MAKASEQNNNHPVMEYAGFWRRLAAQIIDGFVFLIPNYLIFFIFQRDLFLGNVIYMAILSAYYIGFLSSNWQATLGKRLMKVYVVTKNGGKAGIARITTRFFLFLFPGLPVFIPSFYFLYLTPQEQAALVNAQGYQYIHQLAFTFYAVLAAMLIGVAVLLLIWYVPVFFTKEKKSIVDMICGTRIVRGKVTAIPKK